MLFNKNYLYICFYAIQKKVAHKLSEGKNLSTLLAIILTPYPNQRKDKNHPTKNQLQFKQTNQTKT